MTRAWIATGSNLGDRAARIEAALAELERDPRVRGLVASRLVETEPVGGPAGQPRFLNGVARLDFEGQAEALLDLLQALEERAGRVRAEPNGPRTLDLDLLFFGDLELSGPRLTVPHPRLEERPFVLEPLVELEPTLRLPRSGRTAVEQLAHLRRESDTAQA
ncbi:MAG: 2-amino-4-hydroxy-6-hydroxymethyldihydropteridine diphosphokinase [Planctomycetota bacterium]